MQVPISSDLSKSVTVNDIARSPILDNKLVAGFQDPVNFIASAIFPTIASPKQSDIYYVLDMASVQQDKAKVRAPGTKVEMGSWDMTPSSFLCEQYGYGELIPREVMNTNPDAEVIRSASVAEQVLINSERRFGTAYWKTGVWSLDRTGNATASGTQFVYWSLPASTPIDDVLDLKLKILLLGGREPNTLALGATTAMKLMVNPQILSRLNSVVGGAGASSIKKASLEDLAKVFEVERVVVSKSVYNSAKESVAANNAFCLAADSAWLGYVAPNPSVMDTSAGYRFAWSGNAGNPMGVHTYSWYEQSLWSQVVASLVDDVYKVINAKNAAFISAVVV